MDCSLPGSSVHGDSPGKNTRVGCHALLQGIFPIQGSKPGLPHCRQIFYHLSHQGSPRILEGVAYPFSRGSSWPRNWTSISCIADRFFTSWATREAQCPAAAAAKSLQSCPTLCDPRDGSPPGSPVPGILQARTLEWLAISFSNAQKWKVKVKLFSCVRLLATPWTAAYQAPPSMGFSKVPNNKNRSILRHWLINMKFQSTGDKESLFIEVEEIILHIKEQETKWHWISLQ